MANVEGAYSSLDDLLIGDVPLSMRHGDGSGMVKLAAKEIDASIGHIYVTPIVVDLDPKFRPTVLLLERINNLLASGRLIMDMAIAGEDHETQAYGRSLVKEALNYLTQIAKGEIVLKGVVRIDGEATEGNKITILNEDENSLVEAFYRRAAGEWVTGVRPYTEESTYF